MASYAPDEEDDERDPSTDVAAALTNPESEDASSAAVQEPQKGAAASSYPPAAGTNAGSDSGTDDDAEWAGQSQQPVAKTTAQPANESNASSDDETNWVGATAPSNPSLLPQDSANLKPTLPTYNGPDSDIGEAIWSKIAQDSKPTDPNAPGIKPGIGTRVQAALAAGLVGYKNPEAGTRLGKSITDRNLNQAEAQRQGTLQGDQAALADYNQQRQQAGQDFERDMQGYRGQVEEQNAQTTSARQADLQKRQDSVVDPTTMEPDDPNSPLGGWHGMNRGGQQVTGLRPPPNDERVKTATEQARREQLVKDNNLTGDEAKYVRINGKLKEPSPTTNVKVPSADADALAMAKDAWKRENPGKQPTMADVLAIRRAAKGDADQGGGRSRGTPQQFAAAEEKTSSAYKKAEDDHNAGILNDQEFAQEKSRIAGENDEVTRSLGGIPAGNSGSGQPAQPEKPASAPAPTPATKPSAPLAQRTAGLKPGDPILVDGQPKTFTRMGPDGRPMYK